MDAIAMSKIKQQIRQNRKLMLKSLRNNLKPTSKQVLLKEFSTILIPSIVLV